MMIDTRSEILTLLRGTMLSDAKVIELEIPESQERAFAIEIRPDNGVFMKDRNW